MKKVIIYSTQNCPFCVRAKALFQEKGVDFEEVDVTTDAEKRAEISEKTGWMTVPMIFIGDEFIGGYQEALELDSSGELGRMIARG